MPDTLKSRLQNGETCIGGWLSVSSPQVAEAMASCGFDWIAVDMEHSLHNMADIHLCFAAMERHGCAPMVRLSSADPYLARQMLDAGAQGMIVPVVEDVEEFKSFAAHCYYPPRGRRGVGVSRQMLWGDSFDEYMKNFSPLLIPQIETTSGVAVSDALCKLDCVDGLFLGPYDLSASLGTPGNFKTPEFDAAIEIVKAACLNNHKSPGFHQVAPEMELLNARLEEGYRLVAFGTDMFAMRHSFQDVRAVQRKPV